MFLLASVDSFGGRPLPHFVASFGTMLSRGNPLVEVELLVAQIDVSLGKPNVKGLMLTGILGGVVGGLGIETATVGMWIVRGLGPVV